MKKFEHLKHGIETVRLYLKEKNLDNMLAVFLAMKEVPYMNNGRDFVKLVEGYYCEDVMKYWPLVKLETEPQEAPRKGKK
jgi:hypothetical protein